MERSRLFLLLAVAGFVLMVAGFAGYVVQPTAAFEAVFVVGLVMVFGSYGMLVLSNKKAGEAVTRLMESEAVDGYVYYMSGEPEPNDATIIDMTRRRCPR